MFEQAMLGSVPLGNRLWSTFAGVTGQVLLVGGMILVPLVFPQVLPQVKLLATIVPPLPPPAPRGPTSVQPRPTMAPAREFRCTFCAPISVPAQIDMSIEEPPQVQDAGVIGGIDTGAKSGFRDGVFGSILGAIPQIAPPRPPAAAAAPKVVEAAPIPRFRVGGQVILASPIHRVEPQYPQLAKQARVSGTVELEGIIGIDGRIHDLRIVSGHPLLVKAAYDAVKQWIYRPGTLNGDPVEVIAPITVTFRLN